MWMRTDDKILVWRDCIPIIRSTFTLFRGQSKQSAAYQHIRYDSISKPSTSFPKMPCITDAISWRRIFGHSDCLSSGLSVGGVEMTLPEASCLYLLVKLASLQNFKICS